MNSLFLYPANGAVFNQEEILKCLQGLDGLSDFCLNSDGFSLCAGRFEFDGESNLFELRKSLDAIVLGREGRAALKLGFDIQEVYSECLNVTNKSFSVELSPRDFESFQDFEEEFLAALQ
ncbi:hypothetical protein [Luteolibacter luteus]|uniref:Uncharacterized protein n=1 Tax=Luteolibacter luteus TaxID=2728835 RepID=A0A858RG62_9BACT|nr:hypothetical protein [Luteolibacter luteus]QJE95752.1 hypothetical protein HHL09_08125 [Luteolibacter luteus]